MFKHGKKSEREYHSLLRIQGPNGHVWIVDLVGDSYTLGRGDPTSTSTVDFQVPDDEYLSRAHMRFFRDEDRYRIENLSPNGTLVNGTLIEEPTLLKGKEKVEAGQGTTVTYLHVSTDERKRLLDDESGVKERQAETGGGEAPTARKPFYARPIFIGVVAFYGVLALVVMGLLKEDKAQVGDPGEGPYFEYVLRSPVSAQRPEGDAQSQADRMWEEALAEHSGDVLEEGGHAYELLQAARNVAGVMGYATLGQALEKGEPFAQRAQLVLDDLEERVAATYAEAAGYLKGRHWGLAYESYARMAAAVPDTRAPIRRFAVHRMARLRKMR